MSMWEVVPDCPRFTTIVDYRQTPHIKGDHTANQSKDGNIFIGALGPLGDSVGQVSDS